jgi:hypothetical protein
MSMTLVAFGMPFVTLIFMGALAFGVARYNRHAASKNDEQLSLHLDGTARQP